MDGVKRFRVNTPKVIHETIDNEVVMIHFDSGNYYSLDKIGADIWGFIKNIATVGEIVEELAHRYEADRTLIEDAVHGLITEFLKEDLITRDHSIESMVATSSEVHIDFNTIQKDRPRFEAPVLHKYTDMQELLLLDPIHEFDEAGWPSARPESQNEDAQADS